VYLPSVFAAQKYPVIILAAEYPTWRDTAALPRHRFVVRLCSVEERLNASAHNFERYPLRCSHDYADILQFYFSFLYYGTSHTSFATQKKRQDLFMAQTMNKKAKKTRMAKYDPENAHAWNIILAEVKKLKASGLRQHDIAKKMGVKQDSISRWLNEERGGERTTFGAMLRYADALDIPYNELLKKGSLTVAEPAKATSFDKAVVGILEEFASDDGLTLSDLAKKTQIPASHLNAVFSGEIEINVTMLHAICSAIDVGANLVLKRATKKLEQEQKDTTANAVTRSA
jgi:transcriptional regulator with XRE-family HTH domain